MPAEFTSPDGENGLFGSGSIGGTFGGCWPQVSQEPSSSETRRRLSLNSAVSFSLNPGTALGIGDAGLGRGPGSCALKEAAPFWATTAALTITARTKITRAKRLATKKVRLETR